MNPESSMPKGCENLDVRAGTLRGRGDSGHELRETRDLPGGGGVYLERLKSQLSPATYAGMRNAICAGFNML